MNYSKASPYGVKTNIHLLKITCCNDLGQRIVKNFGRVVEAYFKEQCRI
jgi:hypothetical protein